MRNGPDGWRFLDPEDVETTLADYLCNPWPASDYAGWPSKEESCPVTMALLTRYSGATIANTRRDYANFHSPVVKVSGARIGHTLRVKRFIWRVDAHESHDEPITFTRARAIWEGTPHDL